MGVGLGIITGSTLRMLAPEIIKSELPLSTWFGLQEEGSTATMRSAQDVTLVVESNMASLGQFETRWEITALSQRWYELASGEPDLTASAFVLVLDDGRYAELTPDTRLPAASSIKAPILVTALELIDTGELQWHEPLVLNREIVAGGAGWMGSRPLGTSFPAHEVATEMIRVSDNTATNLLIQRIGGREVLNSRFNALGLSSTVVNSWLPDLEGTNTTSARDLARSIALVETGEILRPRSRDLFREVMGTSVTNTLIPMGLLQGLGGNQEAPDDNLLAKGYRVYNKTGDIGIVYADGGLIELPDGRRAVAAFIVKGPFNDPRSTNLIRSFAAAMAPSLQPQPLSLQTNLISARL